MLDKITDHIKSIPKSAWVFILIVAVGVFLRTYNFSEWLIFNSDQARDASVVREMVEKGNRPLLGPVAGGTQFKLGPAFYYFQYAGAKIFGATPDKMAYADLLFGILAIPLMYLLARQYFEKNISLALAATYATAFFAVQYSRFAWNPNSAQFFSMLFVYAMLKLYDSRFKKRTGWLVLAGISLGIGVQLHTLLLFGMPVAFLAAGAYMREKKYLKFSSLVWIVLIASLLNVTQIASEIKTGGANYDEFIFALLGKSDHQNPLWKNALFVAACQAQSGVKILVPYEGQEDCDFPLADKYLKRLKNRMDGSFLDWSVYASKIMAVLVFSGGSCWLVYRQFRKKESEKKEKFIILAVFTLALTLIFVPFGAEISLRYFILLIFVPFLLLGLWLEFLWEQNRKMLDALATGMIVALIGYNLFFCLMVFRDYANDVPGGMVDGTADQAAEMADYMIERSGFAEKIQLSGQKIYLGRFYNRISYFAKERGVEMIPADNGGNVIDKDLPLFFAINGMSGECEVGAAYKKYGYIEDCKKMYDVAILKMRIAE